MNKKVIMFFASLFGIIGAYLPVLFGNMDFTVSILGGFVGGMVGIWLAVLFLKRWG